MSDPNPGVLFRTPGFFACLRAPEPQAHAGRPIENLHPMHTLFSIYLAKLEASFEHRCALRRPISISGISGRPSAGPNIARSAGTPQRAVTVTASPARTIVNSPERLGQTSAIQWLRPVLLSVC